MSGRLVVFEGIDGSGKSTQFKLMCDRLRSEGAQFRQIVFPRYDKESSALIRMYLGGEFGTDPDAVNAYAASSFFAVDRYASYIQDWREYYNSGGLILTDRYTTSNALHQGAKMTECKRRDFFKWLYEYEFDLIGLPKPSLVLFININVELAAAHMAARRAQTDTHADIHEQDMEYLANSAQSGAQAAEQLGWYIIESEDESGERTIEEIHEEIYTRLKCLMTGNN